MACLRNKRFLCFLPHLLTASLQMVCDYSIQSLWSFNNLMIWNWSIEPIERTIFVSMKLCQKLAFNTQKGREQLMNRKFRLLVLLLSKRWATENNKYKWMDICIQESFIMKTLRFFTLRIHGSKLKHREQASPGIVWRTHPVESSADYGSSLWKHQLVHWYLFFLLPQSTALLF